jgi:NAD(P)-dependent dehydrogenase (short-subunit alcohol dehydrogenase family)
LGANIVEKALAEGHLVVATSRNADSLHERYSNDQRVLVLPVDITDAAAVADAVDTAVAHFGRIDVLVNNAGYGHVGIFEETSLDEYRAQFETNVFGTFAVTQAVLPTMRKQRSGTVINISSYAGFTAGFGRSAYNPSKFAIEGWSEALAAEVAPFGINVVCVSPGFFRTDIWDASSMRYSAAAGSIDDYAEAWAQFRATHESLNHTQNGDPAKLAELICTLSRMPEPPRSILAGSETVAKYEALLKGKLENLHRWRELTESTDGQW